MLLAQKGAEVAMVVVLVVGATVVGASVVVLVV